MLLYLVRHGKAERSAASGRDQDRDLNERGERQAVWLGQQIARRPAGEHPLMILTSPAVRAERTARLIQSVLNVELRVEQALSLGASIDETVDLIQRAIEAGRPAMFVGHNPVMEHLVASLTGDAAAEMRTGEAVVIEIAGGEAQRVTRMRMDD